ncbi:MAG: molybdopterin-dependent oxidoreductase [Candidatus Latescibacteria bacterium]|nr:molybdopterin-dependent oxidoreductase [Candidatus Latescibacterota bacterium]
MPTIKIDEKEVTVDAGLTLIQAAATAGIDIPHFCYHPGLPIDGNCRMCLVEMEIRPGVFGLVAGCVQTVTKDGMQIRTNTPTVLKNREGVMEFFLINHPLDCPWCDQAGECRLQDYSFEHGRADSRFVETKRVPPKKDLGPHILLYSTRCILCTRCIRFCDEIAGTSELGIVHMGSHSEIDTFPGQPLDNKLSGNVADICPVGALVTKDFLYKPRIWHYTTVRTICTGCSTGCNTMMEVMHQKIYRIRPRENMEVNQYWMCDDGRFGYHALQEAERVKVPMKRVNGTLQATTWKEALQAVSDGFSRLIGETGQSAVGVVGSAQWTNEENFLLSKLAREAFKTSHIGLYVKPPGEGWVSKSGFRIEADKTPNARGAREMLGAADMRGIVDGINAGTIKGLYIVGGDLGLVLSAAEKEALGKLECLVVQDIVHSELVDLAHVVLAGASWAEKDGTMTNVNGRVQRLRRAFPPPGEARTDGEIIRQVGKQCGVDLGPGAPAEIMNEIARTVEGYAGLSYSVIGEQGAMTGIGQPSEAAGG